MLEGSFRSALNGFNRQDVAAYIEGLAGRVKAAQEERDKLAQEKAELAAQVAQLQQENAQQQETVLQLQRQVQESDSALQQAAQELSAAVQKQTETQAELEDRGVRLLALEAVSANKAETGRQLSDLTAENARLTAELEACRSRLSETEAQVQEYSTLKERVMGLELQASRRAVEIEHEAAQQAACIRQKAEEEAAGVRQERENIARQFRGELRRMAQDTRFSSALLNKQLNQLSETLLGLVASMEASAEVFGNGVEETDAAAGPDDPSMNAAADTEENA